MWQRIEFVEKYFASHNAVMALVSLEEVEKLAKNGDPLWRGAMILLSQVFDAGREFQKQHPNADVEGFLPFPLK